MKFLYLQIYTKDESYKWFNFYGVKCTLLSCSSTENCQGFDYIVLNGKAIYIVIISIVLANYYTGQIGLGLWQISPLLFMSHGDT